MKRALRVTGIIALVGIIVFALWIAHRRSAGRSARESLKDTIDSAFSNSVRFTKSHFTGGVGAMLKIDPVTGIPIIVQVVPGSPAEKAGLRKDDAIIQVDGVPTKGQLLAQTVDRMRGFAARSVTLTIQGVLPKTKIHWLTLNIVLRKESKLSI